MILAFIDPLNNGNIVCLILVDCLILGWTLSTKVDILKGGYITTTTTMMSNKVKRNCPAVRGVTQKLEHEPTWFGLVLL